MPQNLFFTGTVNIDETTHMFSPKVLDRAFVLELNDVDLSGYGEGEAEPSPLRLVGLEQLVYDDGGRPDADDWKELCALVDGELRDVIVGVNDVLAAENRHFGYRVANEIARFVAIVAAQAGSDAPRLWAALDLALHAKVLPKLHGTQQELQALIEQLFSFAVRGVAADEHEPIANWTVAGTRLQRADGGSSEVQPALPRTAAKLWRMHRRLRTRGFTSFIE